MAGFSNDGVRCPAATRRGDGVSARLPLPLMHVAAAAWILAFAAFLAVYAPMLIARGRPG